MRPLLTLCAMLSISLFIPLKAIAAGHYKVDSKVSTVSFATIKKQYVVEPAVISGLSGNLDDKGMLSVMVPLKNLDTGVSIRNDRLNELFFNAATFSDVKISAQVPAELMKGDRVITQATIPATVTLYGKTQTLDFMLNIVRVGEIISVSSVKPVIVDAGSFGIPKANLQAVSKTVGDIAISATVAVNVSLVLIK
ncbi:hypothetical protein VSU01S_13970 [Vibrio superstes NBRC 103154]|uniref:Lipid/polyisoprenoid-binding YceI-like domain-containing protein n=2 Tax=Vibrio superstes TaxID=198815 RepID=A0A511QRE2_9VIBR|nr:hypothetical protein VSU01S_13970 [Vibrio superstes NBRC 103154]